VRAGFRWRVISKPAATDEIDPGRITRTCNALLVNWQVRTGAGVLLENDKSVLRSFAD
jgi:hypothetical protein